MSSITSVLLRFALLSAATLVALPAVAQSRVDADALKAGLEAQARREFRPVSAMGVSGSPTAQKLLIWDRLRRPEYAATFSEFSEFLRANADWPGADDLRRRAEGTISDTTPMAARLSFFRALPPLSGIGRFRHAEALMAAGMTNAANTEAKQAWRMGGIGPALENQFLAAFGGILSRDDHVFRMDRLLWLRDLSTATRMLAFLSGSDRTLAEARIALQRAAAAKGAASAPAAVDANLAIGKLGTGFENDPGLIADRSAFLRASGNSLAARQLLARAEIAPGSAGDRNAWMTEVLAAARGAVNDNQNSLAFEIAHNHGGFAFDRALTSYSAAERDTFTSLEWLAGWTALHKLNRAREAVRHFENFAAAAAFAGTRSRGHYWAGRAAEAAGLTIDANRNLETAARFPLTFYGQLAAERLNRPLSIPATADPAVPTPERQAFAADDRVEAARLLGMAGDRAKQTLFLKTLADGAKTSAREFLVSELAQQLGRADYALIASRGEMVDGPPAILRFAYPQLPVGGVLTSNWTMIHAITRQESRFDPTAVSRAGARGLMQLMPGTARETAGKMGTTYRPEALTGDPNYNVQLGSTYYLNLVDQWGGNHMLAVASYNAGAGNVRKWITANGDPRLPSVDAVRWVEEIPFTETRGYVRAVLENAVVYDRLNPSRAGQPSTNTLSAWIGKNRPG